MAGTINVRLASSHSIYKEQGLDGLNPYDLHLTGFDPEDGQVIRTEAGEVLTPVVEVPRTDGVLAAIGEKRLLDVHSPAEVERINQEMVAARARRVAARPAPEPAPGTAQDRATIAALTARLDALEAQQAQVSRKGGRGATSPDGATDPSALVNPDGTPAGV